MKRIVLMAFSLLLFVGCAHVSKQDCLERDWYGMGLSAGAAGNARADMRKVAASCKRFEMANPPEQQYNIGYDTGVKQYCNSERGFSFGQRGEHYPSICMNAAVAFPELVEGWKKGVATYCSYDQGKASGEKGQDQHELCETSLHAVYYKGFENGARSYCADPRTGFLRGKAGRSSFPHCPGTLAQKFESAFAQGSRLYSEISSMRGRVANLDSRISNLRARDSSLAYSIANHESRTRQIGYDIDNENSRISRLESELRRCTRQASLCSDSYVEDLERQLRRASDTKSDLQRQRSEIALEHPRFIAERTTIAIEIATLQNQRPALARDLSRLEAQDWLP